MYDIARTDELDVNYLIRTSFFGIDLECLINKDER